MPATYRYEIAKTARAACQSASCKNEGVKIEKGELRLGSLVKIKEHDTWKWKHWGCVTPKQIETVIEQIGGLEGLDLDSDLDILDGYDELPDWAQEKIKLALQNGHVDDSDWKGDPELNRPGQRGIHKRQKKKKGDEDEQATGASEAGTPNPKTKRVSKKDIGDDGTVEDDTYAKPKKTKASKKRKAADGDDEDELALGVDEPKKKKRESKKTKQAAQAEEGLRNDDEPNEPPKKAKKAKSVKTEIKDEDTPDEPAASELPKKVRKSAKGKSNEGDTPVDEDVTSTQGKTKKAGKVTKGNVKAESDPRATGSTKVDKSSKPKRVKEEDNEDNEEASLAMPKKQDKKPRGKKAKNEAPEETPADATAKLPSRKKSKTKG